MLKVMALYLNQSELLAWTYSYWCINMSCSKYLDQYHIFSWQLSDLNMSPWGMMHSAFLFWAGVRAERTKLLDQNWFQTRPLLILSKPLTISRTFACVACDCKTVNSLGAMMNKIWMFYTLSLNNNNSKNVIGNYIIIFLCDVSLQDLSSRSSPQFIVLCIKL